MTPHEERVYTEREELLVKIAGLHKFLQCNPFLGLDPADRELLRSQLIAMEMYSDILDMRIDRFY